MANDLYLKEAAICMQKDPRCAFHREQLNDFFFYLHTYVFPSLSSSQKMEVEREIAILRNNLNFPPIEISPSDRERWKKEGRL